MDRNESAPGIVVKTERKGERDRVATILSPVWGLRRVTVHGALKSRKSVKAPLWTEAVFHVWNNPERRQVSLVDLNIISIHENALSSVPCSLAATLMAEAAIEDRGADAPAVYQLLAECLDVLSDDNHKRVVAQYLLRLLKASGLSSGYTSCPVCGRPYGEAEVLGFSASLGSPCCPDCDTMGGAVVLPPNARRYVRDSLAAPLSEALGWGVSPMMEARLERWCVRLHALATGRGLRSADALLALDAADI